MNEMNEWFVASVLLIGVLTGLVIALLAVALHRTAPHYSLPEPDMKTKLPLGDDLLTLPGYEPAAFLDWLITDVYRVDNSSALARQLGVSHTTISQIRNRHQGVGPAIMVTISDNTGMTVRDLHARLVATVR